MEYYIMGSQDSTSEAPIVMKYAYIKLLYLTDMRKFKDKPVLRKALRGSTELVNLYDAGLFYVNTRFNVNKPRHFNWEFTSEQGTVDDVFQLYPFKFAIKANEQGTENDPRRRMNPVDTKITDSVIVVAHHYNAFQAGREWAGARADDDTEGIRIVVDFSSITTLPGKEDRLFATEPQAEMAKAISGIKEPVIVDRISNRIFSASYNNASKHDVLKMNWAINWDNLALWQPFSEVKEIKEGERVETEIPTW